MRWRGSNNNDLTQEEQDIIAENVDIEHVLKLGNPTLWRRKP